MTTLAVTLALAADLLTASPAREINPLIKPILDTSPLAAVILKVAEVIFVLATITVVRRWWPNVARFVAVVAVGAGLLGAASNL